MSAGKVSVEIIFQFKDRRKRDIDNHLKTILDAIKGHLFEDDSEIYEIRATKQIGCASDVIVVKVNKIT